MLHVFTKNEEFLRDFNRYYHEEDGFPKAEAVAIVFEDEKFKLYPIDEGAEDYEKALANALPYEEYKVGESEEVEGIFVKEFERYGVKDMAIINTKQYLKEKQSYDEEDLKRVPEGQFAIIFEINIDGERYFVELNSYPEIVNLGYPTIDSPDVMSWWVDGWTGGVQKCLNLDENDEIVKRIGIEIGLY